MTSAEYENVVEQASTILIELRQPDGRRPAVSADDLLLYCYRLRDRCRIIRSASERFKGTSFSFLHDLLYELESRPEETMRSPEWKKYIESLLTDIASGKIVITNK
jgi:hypothetical protein